MLTSYRLLLTPDRTCMPEPEWAYRLYAALLARAPAEFGAAVHADAVTPVSQYLTESEGSLVWKISLLGADCERALAPLLEEDMPFLLTRECCALRPTVLEKRTVAGVEALLDDAAVCSGRHELCFLSPTAFKSRGQYVILPSARLILQSLIKKWNGCFFDCPIEDEDGQGLDALANGLVVRHLDLRDTAYRLKSGKVPGFTGALVLENRLFGFQRQLTDALLLFSGFAGIGIKTALGMGGTEYNPGG